MGETWQRVTDVVAGADSWMLISSDTSREIRRGLGQSCNLSEPTPTDTFPPAKVHLLNLPDSTTNYFWAYGDTSHSKPRRREKKWEWKGPCAGGSSIAGSECRQSTEMVWVLIRPMTPVKPDKEKEECECLLGEEVGSSFSTMWHVDTHLNKE